MRVRDLAGHLVTGTLVLCALGMTALVVRRELFGGGTGRQSVQLKDVDWMQLTNTGRRMGPSTASVRIVEFSDFECPFCRKMSFRLDSLRQRHPADVAVVYHHFPLVQHLHALAAANAAECAADQDAFEAFHDKLFQRPDLVEAEAWDSVGRLVGLEPTRFLACVASAEHRDAVQRDVQEGERLGIEGTPAIIIRGSMTTGTIATTELEEMVDDALRDNRSGLADQE